MNDKKSLKTVSKFLSLILRHQPQSIGLELDAKGWASINELIEKADIPLTEELITNVVKISDKQRFILSEDGRSIRANQGHSIKIDLELVTENPPEHLFHGTATRNLDSIRRSGLQRQNRHHVHLSLDHDTAINVGKRHGEPVVLTVLAERLHASGQDFYCSKNGVWLTLAVPPEYLILP